MASLGQITQPREPLSEIFLLRRRFDRPIIRSRIRFNSRVASVFTNAGEQVRVSAKASVSEKVIEEEAKVLVGTYARAPVVLSSGKGCKLFDPEGKEYLDCASGIAVNALGHGDPDWLRAVTQQAAVLAHVSNVYYTIPQIELAKRLVASSFADRVFFCNSGTEANEAAIKFSRKFQRFTHPEDKEVAIGFIAFSNSFHGRTLGALALTSKEQYRTPFEPIMPGVTFLEYGNIQAATDLIRSGTIAAVFVEPIQGEGGIYSASKEFLLSLRSACDAAGSLLVFDEVQCGLGRTGNLWAYEAFGVTPDIMTVAKPLAGGLPIGAVLVTEKVAETIKYGDHGSTFAGNPLVCNAAIAVLDKVSKPSFLSSVSSKGQYFKDLLVKKLGGNTHVKEVRGEGLIIGVELDVQANSLVDACRDSGLLILTAGKGNVVRIVPPLVKFPATLRALTKQPLAPCRVRCAVASPGKKRYNITLLPGDGIGPEVISIAKSVLQQAGSLEGVEFSFREMPIGGAALDLVGVPLPEETISAAKESDAVLLGAIGGYKWDNNEKHLRPEKGLLQLRAGLKVFANLRPATVLPQLVDASTLKREVAEGVDLMVVRELTGGIYFGEPRGIKTNENGEEVGFNTEVYAAHEIDRIARVAFETARKRRGKLCSVDKANVLDASILWRKRVTTLASEYPDVELSHMYVDNAAMQLVRDPKQFDTIFTNNIFGDILSDEASMITGSIGMLPSASLSDSGPGLFEPIHGSAPDIAGQDKANPLATILSAAMLLKYGLGEEKAAKRIEDAVLVALNKGFRTGDIYSTGTKLVGCKEMGEEVLKSVDSQVPASV